jgi:hypothetical protein
MAKKSIKPSETPNNVIALSGFKKPPQAKIAPPKKNPAGMSNEERVIRNLIKSLLETDETRSAVPKIKINRTDLALRLMAIQSRVLTDDLDQGDINYANAQLDDITRIFDENKANR